MNYGLLFCLLLSHVVADFIFQSNTILNMRHNSKSKIFVKGNLIHSIIVLVATFTCTIYYTYNNFSVKLIVLILIIPISHFLIDLLKSFLINIKPFLKYSIFYFLFDQLAHILIIFISSIIISVNLLGKNLTTVLFKTIFLNSIKFNNISLTYNEKIILSIFLFVVGVWSMGVFIKIFCKYIKNKQFKSAINKGIEIQENLLSKTGAENGGYLIGILERIFIIIAIVLLKPEIIGFVLTTKSIARFKKFDDDSFVEYFIIGTFISFISAIIIGIIIKNLNIILLY